MTTRVLTAGRLELVFQWRTDRWAHQIQRPDGEGRAAVMASIEGAEQDQWPPSPVLQSLHVEPGPGGRSIAFLVGSAGSSHWSASVEAEPAADRLTFDVACRIKSMPAVLGSSYQLASDCGLASLEANGQNQSIRIGVADVNNNDRVKEKHPICLFTLLSLPDGEIAELRQMATGPVVMVTAADGTWPRTVRWRYSIAVA